MKNAKKIIIVCIVILISCTCFFIGQRIGSKDSQRYRDLLAIYIEQDSATREAYRRVEESNIELREELSILKSNIDGATNVINRFEETIRGSKSDIQKALTGIQTLREIIKVLQDK